MFARLRSNTPETFNCGPPLTTYQNIQHGLDSINKTKISDISSGLKNSVTVENGLDQLPAVSPSLSLEDVILPVITSTQENPHNAPNISCSDSSALITERCKFEQKKQRNQPVTRGNNALQSENMAAETGTFTDLHAKLSAFIFKPREKKPSDHMNIETETLKNKERNNQISISHDDLASQPPQAKKKKLMEKKEHWLSEGCSTKPTIAQTYLKKLPHETQTSECQLQQSDLTYVPDQHVKPASDGGVNMKKRKCFNLKPPQNNDGSKQFFSGFSLSGLADISNDVLDTDWDQEVSNNTKA